MSPALLNRTKEQRRASAAKGHATRRANLEANAVREAIRQELATDLGRKIVELERKLSALERAEAMTLVAVKVTGKSLLTEDEIVAAAKAWEDPCGVYFLVSKGKVVYVGQSVNVMSRIRNHTDKQFDSYAYFPCRKEVLDALESLYIHVFRPPLNGRLPDGSNHAPLALVDVLKVAA